MAVPFMALRRDPRRADSFADVLVWAAKVDPTTLINKNGSFTRAYTFRLRDAASATDRDIVGDSFHINAAMAQLGSGWVLNVDVLRQEAPGYPEAGRSGFGHPLLAAMDEERRRVCLQRGKQYAQRFVLTLTYAPPSLAEHRLGKWVFAQEGGASTQNDAVSYAREALAGFHKACQTLVDRLSLVMEFAPLGVQTHIGEDGREFVTDDLLRYLNVRVTGIDRPVVVPRVPIYLDHLIGGEDFYTGITPKIGRHLIACVSLDGFPNESSPGMLNALAELPCAYTWSTRWIALDQHAAIAHVEKAQKKWEQRIRPFLAQLMDDDRGRPDRDAADMADDGDLAKTELSAGAAAGGFYTSTLVLMAEAFEDLDQATRDAVRVIHGLGFGARIETINTVEAFLGSLPGHAWENVRKFPINSANLADLIPSSTIWTGEATAPCPMYPTDAPALLQAITTGSTPFYLNLHVGDVGHTLVFGPIGAGKSTLLCTLIAAAFRYPGMKVFAFETGRSAEVLTKACGGWHYRLGADAAGLALAPLQQLDSTEDRAWAAQWIEDLCELNGLALTPAQRNHLTEVVKSLSQHGSRTMSHCRALIQDSDIKDVLKTYTLDNPMGALLDAEGDGLAMGNFVTFELEELMEQGERYVIPTLLYLFRQIEKRLKGQPALLVLDEAWQWLDHPVFRAKLRRWLKELRKRNCAVVMATQSLSDVSNSGILDVLLESTATKIFLPNLFATDPDTAALYRRMGLNDTQIQIIAGAIPKRQYYATSKQGRRLFELGLGPLAMAFVGVSDRDRVLQAEELQRQCGEGWVSEWLRLHHLRWEDYAHE
jgi:type IV secretion system protein VirB4